MVDISWVYEQIAEFAKKHDVQRVVLFGSRTRCCMTTSQSSNASPMKLLRDTGICLMQLTSSANRWNRGRSSSAAFSWS